MGFQKRKNLMQYKLLEMALAECGVYDAEIFIDHIRGSNKVNDVLLDLKYPHSFIKKINNLSTEKLYDYVFKGTTSFSDSSIQRADLLKPFDSPNNRIVSTNHGMRREDKTAFDESYYQLLSNGRYSLCPNWGGKHWDHDFAWTYRFVESALCKTIPIVFDETPLGRNNTKNIIYFSNHNLPTLTDDEYAEIVEKNYVNAVKHWTLQDTEIEQIKMNS